ncbi:MAG TPA: glycosyl hydrolase family 18 protein [Candidatus Kapabacteria bacterium]|nr:glycosyl hydrolase family 18 protein [Candidatus Kapabacteria bacterium]
MSTPGKSVNAWIFLGEDEPSGSNYTTPGSSYQSLIAYGVYNYLDMVNICFANTVQTDFTTVPMGDGSTYTIDLQTASHPDGYSNQQYMDWLIRDARAANPDVKILITLGYGRNEFTQIFSGPQSGWQQAATDFANNLVAYLEYYNLDGFDVDWEYPLSSAGTLQQFQILFTAIRFAFSAQSRYYYLTLSPADVGTLDGQTVSDAFDFVNLQLYSGFTDPGEFIRAGVSRSLLAYGAKFEVNGTLPYQTAQNAYNGYTSGGYNVITQWRLNSNDFQYEQAQQMILYELVFGIPGSTFDDTAIVGAAGNPPISQMVIRSGDVVDAIQTTNTGRFQGTTVQYQQLQHGGSSGNSSTVKIQGGDAITEITGFTGEWYGWNCVLQITIKTRNGSTYGPFGSMNGSTSQMPFTYTAPQGESIVAFSGSTVNVPLAGGGNTDIIASLNVSFA